VTGQAQNPKGPTGQRFHILGPWSHSIFTTAPDVQASKDFLVWLMDPKQVAGWYDIAVSYYAPFLHMFDNAPLWTAEPRNLPYRESLATSHLPGWPAPISRQQGESVAKYVVVDIVRQGLRREIHQRGHRRREGAIDQNLQASLTVSTTTLPAAVYVPAPRRVSGFRRWTEREDVFSLVDGSFRQWPSCCCWWDILSSTAFWLSLENRPVARAGTFVALANFIADARDPVFWQVVQNTFVYTFSRPC